MDLEKDARFQALNVELISIMADPAYKLRPEVESRGITTTVASDSTLAASKDYGALGMSMHPGIKPGHTFILVNGMGKITWRWDWSEEKGEMYLAVDSLDAGVAAALTAPES